MLSLQSFTTMISNMAANVRGSSWAFVDLTAGSVIRAILEAFAAQVLWLQTLILLVLAQTRLLTSTGSAVDSFGADFGFTRLPAVTATGQVTFSRFSAATSALIPVGAQVRTSDGTQTYAVIADATNALYSATSSGFIVPAGTSSATCTVAAATAGSAGNVLANTVTLIVGAVPGVDTVNNANAFGGGINAETDAAFKARFLLFITTRAEATQAAVQYAIAQLGENLTSTIANNANASGVYTPGTFTVAIDDGSGATPSSTVSSAATAINAIRPIGSTAIVVAASKLAANVGMTLAVATGYTAATVAAIVASAIEAYINALPVGAPLPYSVLSKLAYDATPGITNVTSVTLNSGTSDLTPTQSQVVRAGTVTVNP